MSTDEKEDFLSEKVNRLIVEYDCSLNRIAHQIDGNDIEKCFFKLRHSLYLYARPKLDLVVRLLAGLTAGKTRLNAETFDFLIAHSHRWISQILKDTFYVDGHYARNTILPQFTQRKTERLFQVVSPQLRTVYSLLSVVKPSIATLEIALFEAYIEISKDHCLTSLDQSFFTEFADRVRIFFDLD